MRVTIQIVTYKSFRVRQPLRKIHRNTPVLESLFIKVVTLLKRDSNTDVFLSIL